MFPLSFLFLVFLQISIGAFVSGMDAGKIYNSWPLMGNSIFPNDNSIFDLFKLTFLFRKFWQKGFGSKQTNLSKYFDRSFDHKPMFAPISIAKPQSSTNEMALFLCAS